MSDQKPSANPQTSDCEFGDEGNSITGGRSVSEIVQLLRTNTNLQSTSFDIIEVIDDQPSNAELFPWVSRFTASCREVISEPNIKKLDDLIATFLRHVQSAVRQCDKKPKRSCRTSSLINSFLVFFHMIYWEIKKPLEHTSYLDKMSDILALYIDVEMISSRRGREHPKKIAERICSCLFLFLDKSRDHMLDSILKSKSVSRKNSDICVPILARLLKDYPGPMYDTTYVRHLLSFKLWKKLAGKEQFANINKEAVAKLKPPPDFADKLRSGVFSSVLPYVSKSEKDRLTLFFMQSPFNVKKKAQVFLKDGRRTQSINDIDRSTVLEEDLNLTTVFNVESEESGTSLDLLNDIWNGLMDTESDSLDDLFGFESTDEEEQILIDLRNSQCEDKLKKIPKNNTNGIIKSSMKKRKTSKFNSCAPVKSLIKKESKELIRSDNSLIIPIISVEENSLLTSVKVEETLKKDDKTSLSVNKNPEPLKPTKPCATVEPEQSKEMGPDTITIDLTPVNTTEESNLNPVEVVSRDVFNSSNIDQINTATDSFIKLKVPNPELVVTCPLVDNDTSISSSVLADSSGMCGEVKVETNADDFFVVDNMYKSMKEDDERLLEDHLVAEEVVIGTEIIHDEGCTTFLIMDGDGQEKLDHHDIMSVIGIPGGPTTFCSDSVILNTELWKKTQNNQETQLGSLMEMKSNQTNNTNNLKVNSAKEQSSPENHQFLSSIVASSESNDNYVSLDRRQDSYTYNDMMLTRLFTEGNGDDGSDDDNRYHSQSKYAGGGKIPAFREQMEESKSDDGEDFDSSSPASRSDSQKSTLEVEVSPEMSNSQPTPVDINTQEQKTQSLLAEKEEIVPQPCMGTDLCVSQTQLREVSVSLSCITDLENLSEFYVHKEKMTPKGMCFKQDDVLHTNTVDEDCKYFDLQIQLSKLYNTTPNILDTDPVPYPPTSIVSRVINGFDRCPCEICCEHFRILDNNYKKLFSIRSNRICDEVDKRRFLSKMYFQIDQRRMENERLLKAIEESIPKCEAPYDIIRPSKQSIKGENEPVMEEKKCKTEKTQDVKESIVKDASTSPEKLSHKPDTTKPPRTTEESDGRNTKKEYSNLPPKKRKAFSFQPDVVSHGSSQEQSQIIGSDRSQDKVPKKAKLNLEDKSHGSNTSVETNSSGVKNLAGKSTITTKECRVVIDRYSPVKIKAINGQYRVLSENSSSSERLGKTPNANDVSQKDTHSRREKCHKHHKRSKEEKRLKKEKRERKLLKKLMKQRASK